MDSAKAPRRTRSCRAVRRWISALGGACSGGAGKGRATDMDCSERFWSGREELAERSAGLRRTEFSGRRCGRRLGPRHRPAPAGSIGRRQTGSTGRYQPPACAAVAARCPLHTACRPQRSSPCCSADRAPHNRLSGPTNRPRRWGRENCRSWQTPVGSVGGAPCSRFPRRYPCR